LIREAWSILHEIAPETADRSAVGTGDPLLSYPFLVVFLSSYRIGMTGLVKDESIRQITYGPY
jgi:hypothetical protein